MLIKSLRTYNFRNLNDSKVEFSPGINIIIGPNGQGKTNLVEAVSLLSHARSFRTSDSKELIRRDSNEASVFGLIKTSINSPVEFNQAGEQVNEQINELGVALESGRRTTFKNGEKLDSLEEFIGNFICVSFSPSDLEIVKGAPALRRRFLDKHCVDYKRSVLHQLVKYQSALKHKQSLLSNEKDKFSFQSIESQIRVWNRILADSAEKISAVRYEFVDRLQEKVKKIYSEIADDSAFKSETTELLSLKLESDIEPGWDSETIFDCFEKQIEREILARRVRFGPHRDDLAIILSDLDARAFASQGQTRSIVIALKLGVLELIRDIIGESPVILLDDVDSELDAQRLSRLYQVVLRAHQQVIISATEIPRFLLEIDNQKEINKLTVKQGCITRV